MNGVVFMFPAFHEPLPYSVRMPSSESPRAPVDLPLAHVEAAHAAAAQYLPGWQLADATLALLERQLPGHGTEACLAKATVVNSLYGTNVFAIQRVAQLISPILTEANLANAGPELVDRMARVTPERTFVSFASKYAHFFVNPDRFPIYDSYAVKMLALHLGRQPNATGVNAYAAFCGRYNTLAAKVGLTDNFRRLDRYLWLAGIGRELRRKPGALVNAEVREYFKNHPRPVFLPPLAD